MTLPPNDEATYARNSPKLILPNDLLEHLISRRCVAFVGAGFSAPASMPGWAGLLSELIDAAVSYGRASARELQMAEACIRAGEYQLAASAIRKFLTEAQIFDTVEHLYSTQKYLEMLPA